MVVTGRAAIGPANRIAELVAALHVGAGPARRRRGCRIPGARPALSSVYLGGGTPSLLPADQVGGLLDHVHRRFGIAPDAEVTIEANPGPAGAG